MTKRMFWVLDMENELQDYCTFEDLLEKSVFSDEELNAIADLELGKALKLDDGGLEIVRQE